MPPILTSSFPRIFVVFSLIFAATAATIEWPYAAELGKSATTNSKLATSSSPYLQSHSRDLVKWYTWGKEAFETSKKEDKPVMVSFGYTACHWCHVMQETHFNDPEMAATINQNYIPVLVDRERRTALDELYLLVTEALTQQGGWPNTVFLTHEKRPFYATTYVPKEPFSRILAAVTQAWTEDRASLNAESERLARVLNEFNVRKEKAQNLNGEVLAKSAAALVATFDPAFGGTGQDAKFYQQPLMMFLLQQYERDRNPEVLLGIERTLQAIAAGGVQDHLAGGFHRYSTDPTWLVPHFEKMLYDQAQLASMFTTAYRITGNPTYRFTAEKTLQYILDDLTAPSGGFYATRDADSEGEEGTYYVWSPEQLKQVLSPEEAEMIMRVMGIVPGGEFEGKVVLNFFGVQPHHDALLETAMAKLHVAREQRIAPVRDEKIVVNWNGLTIAAMAQAGIQFSNQHYIQAGEKSGEFIWNSLMSANGDLLRIYFNGKAELLGELDDYAQLASGLALLYDATGKIKWLERAEKLADVMLARFLDQDAGDFFATVSKTGFGRFKSRRDIDQPSGNGAALDVLVLLSKRSKNPVYKRAAEKAIGALSGIALSSPTGGNSILAAADWFSRAETSVVQYAGDGRVQVTVKPTQVLGELDIKVRVAKGWHVNAEVPLEEFLIPTKVEVFSGKVNESIAVSYPSPQIKALSFNKQPLALLEGEFLISAKQGNVSMPTGTVSIDVQTCSDKICLLPETLKLNFAWPQPAE